VARRDELEAQLAEMQAELDGLDDDEYEVWIKDDGGRESKVTGRHAKTWLQKLGVVDPDPDPAGEDDGEDQGAGDGKPTTKKKPPAADAKPKRTGYLK